MARLSSLIAASLFFISSTVSNYAETEIKQDATVLYETPIKFERRLGVHNNPKYRTVCRTSEDEGIKEIKALTKEGADEGAWVFLPKEKLWIEIGLKCGRTLSYGPKHTKFYDRLFDIDQPLFGTLIENNSNIVFYHNHPLDKKISSVNDFSGEEDIVYKGLNRDPRFISQVKDLMAIPSSPDLISMLIRSKRFYEISPNGRFEYAIISERGLTRLKITEKGKTQVGNLSPLSLFCRENTEYGRLYSEGIIPKIFPNSITNNLTDWIAALNNSLVEVSFSEWK